jgi:hypothetical protein
MCGNREKSLYKYINKDENPFTRSTRHVEANVKYRRGKPKHSKQ